MDHERRFSDFTGRDKLAQNKGKHRSHVHEHKRVGRQRDTGAKQEGNHKGGETSQDAGKDENTQSK